MDKNDIKKFKGETGGGFKEGECVNCGKAMKGSSCSTCNKPKGRSANKKKDIAQKMVRHDGGNAYITHLGK